MHCDARNEGEENARCFNVYPTSKPSNVMKKNLVDRMRHLLLKQSIPSCDLKSSKKITTLPVVLSEPREGVINSIYLFMRDLNFIGPVQKLVINLDTNE
ncbi:hypothetical protein AVEN_218744-1 [Araneus ventricosus]|uniref:Uncharacterized protein n=1 Tax=Araneus ventricosus TaxID=182803 RepID=A0A4Y2B4B6_ARAVE|nr:hypothetical protein AVEN_218744-1 [Araneus ventricosus]